MTKVMARYFPAEVRLPGQEHGLRTCRVYVTDDGDLRVFTAPDTEALHERIDFAATGEPPPVHPVQTWDVHLAEPDGDGEPRIVRVTPQRGCGCGHVLKRWQPPWSGHLAPWRPPS